MLQKVIDELGIDVTSRRTDYWARAVQRFLQTVPMERVCEKLTAHPVQWSRKRARENKENPLPAFEEIVELLTLKNKVLAIISE